MSPRVWLPVAILGLLGGIGVAYVGQKSSTGDSTDSSTADARSGSGSTAGSSEASTLLVGQGLSEVDRALPEFQLPALDETLWTAETLEGKPWVINFWATWCPPCIEEIPSMNAAYEILEPQGIGMLAINAGEGALAVETFLQKIAIDFPNVLGDAETLINWSVRALPTTIVINADGEVVYEALGPREWDDEQLLQQVVDLL
ncbi:TlpA family protein disulfide reductase [bacterium]|nr:TlpA family protein disulfide reductase [bacterium]